jgi:adenylylsulfate kinase-like enzyme
MSENASKQETESVRADFRQIPFVVVSGLPASGKTTLARRLAPALALPLFDKDDILEGLFEGLGVGDVDWRQRLSRASDEILQRLAQHSNGAVLTSFWRKPEISNPSGTPTDWLADASQPIVEVYCLCDPEVAAARFVNRLRHPGHLDSVKRPEDVLSHFRILAATGPLGLGKLLQVDTTRAIDLNTVVSDIRRLLRGTSPPH